MYEIELDHNLTDVELIVRLFKLEWRTYARRHNNPPERLQKTLDVEIANMLSEDWEHMVQHFEGWFGDKVIFTTPSEREERRKFDREKLDLIEQEGDWT